MITLNDYLYSGDTVFKILQNYMGDLRQESKRTRNEIDLVHCNFLLQIMELLEHNDFLTAQSQKIREFYKYMVVEYPYLSFTFKGRIKSLIRAEEKFNGYIEYVIEEQDEIETEEEMLELIKHLDAREGFYALLEIANKKLKKVLKLLKEKGLGVEVLTEKLKTGERFEHFHITFQCNCLETITKEEYELLNEALNG